MTIQIIIIIIIMIAMLAAIIWLVHDGHVFWSDVEKVAKGKKTKKYFTEFNKTNSSK